MPGSAGGGRFTPRHSSRTATSDSTSNPMLHCSTGIGPRVPPPPPPIVVPISHAAAISRADTQWIARLTMP